MKPEELVWIEDRVGEGLALIETTLGLCVTILLYGCFTAALRTAKVTYGLTVGRKVVRP